MGRPDLLFVFDADEIEKVRLDIIRTCERDSKLSTFTDRCECWKKNDDRKFIKLFIILIFFYVLLSVTETRGQHRLDHLCQGDSPKRSSNISN